MDPDTWIALFAPMLALIAVADSVMHFSARLSAKLGLTQRLWLHTALLATCFALAVASLSWFFPDYSFGAIVDYDDLTEHYFSLFVAPRLVLAEMVIALGSMIAALVIAIVQRQGVLLAPLAALLGSLGTLVWMLLEQPKRTWPHSQR